MFNEKDFYKYFFLNIMFFWLPICLNWKFIKYKIDIF